MNFSHSDRPSQPGRHHAPSLHCWLCVLGLLLAGGSAAWDAEAQPFSFQYVLSDLDPLDFGSLLWGDVDRDGQLDVLLTGVPQQLPPYTPAAHVFLNRGETVVSAGEEGTAPFFLFDTLNLPLRVWHSGAAWDDYDHDGDLDLFLTGATNGAEPFTGTAQLLRNEGGSFTSVATGIRGLYSGSVAWGDYDNDGDEDLLLTGLDAGTYATRLYRRDGGTFVEVDEGFVDVAFGEAAWGDYDRDGDLDVLLAGLAEDGLVSRIYRNDGGTFTASGVALPGLAYSSVAWGDYDADGDLDVLLAGGDVDPRILVGRLYLYRNDGNGRFGLVMQETGGFIDGDVVWGDYTNDGLLDFLVVGARYPDGPRTTRLYQNEAGQMQHRTSLAGTIFGQAAWGDVDGDGDLDVALSGLARNFNVLSNLYENLQKSVNTPPEAPSGLTALVNGNVVDLAWSAAVDAQSSANGLTYNLRVGTTPGGTELVSPLADGTTGQRYVAAPGNVFQNTSWRLRNLGPGTYFWSVQAVDASLAGGPFAEEGSFTISSTAETGTAVGAVDPAHATRLHPGYPNPFREQTTLRYTLHQAAPVRLVVYDMLGRAVRVLVDGVQPAGEQIAMWDGHGASGERAAPGVYLCRLETSTGGLQSSMITLLP